MKLRVSEPATIPPMKTVQRADMVILLKGLIWGVILSVGLFSGIKLIPGFVWCQLVLFATICYAAGQISYKLFRSIDKKFASFK